MKKKFLPALNGLFYALVKEKSTRIQFLLFFIGLIFGLVVHFPLKDWFLFGFASILVIGFEMINTAIEELCNLVDPQPNEQIKKIKGISAGAVLLVSLFAALVGLFLFVKHIC